MGNLRCTQESFSLRGNFNSASAQVLTLNFERCDSTKRATCKSEADFRRWLRNKYLVVAFNGQIFNTDAFEDGKISSELQLDWIKVNLNSQPRQTLQLKMTELQLKDSYNLLA